ncbi:60Kd inner membrane protein-domain-containing protein, partial [Dipodascopsis uninucleata]
SYNIGYLESLGLAQSWLWPPDMFQHLLELVHIGSHSSWGMSIVLLTLGIRLICFPILIKSSDVAMRMAKIKPELDALMSSYVSNTAGGVSLQELGHKRKELLVKHNVKTGWLLAPLINLPIGLGMFFGLNSMSGKNVAGFENQGAFWFTNLSEPDPFFGLPIISAVNFSLLTINGGETGIQSLSPAFKKALVVLPFASMLFTAQLSSGVMVYFATTSAWAIVQSALLRNKAFRSVLGLSEIVKPVNIPSQKQSQNNYQKQWNLILEAAKRAAEETESAKKK